MADKNKKQAWIVIVTFLAVGLFFLIVGFIYYQRIGVVAIVGGEKILKDEYNLRKEMDKRFIEFAYADNENDKNLKMSSLSKDTVDKLVEEEILLQTVEELNIVVTNEEINEKENMLIKSYKNEDEYTEIIKEVYGKSRDEVRQSFKLRLLRDKVSRKMTDKRTVSFIYVRYDVTGMAANKDLSLSQVESLAEKKINEYEDKIASLGFAEVQELAKNDNTDLLVGTDKYTMIDRSIELSDEDKEAIWSLAGGETSDTLKSNGGYWAIYNLDEKTDGSYKDYEAFILAQKKEKNVVIYLPEAVDGSGLVSDLRTIFFGAVDAASCADCSGAKGVKWYGHITDSVTGNKLLGVDMSVENTGAGTQCTVFDTNHHGWCGPKSSDNTTDSNGYYQFGRTDGNYAFVNCGWSGNWKITASKAGYQSFNGNYDIAGRNGGVFELNISLVADSWDNLSATLSANPQEFEVDYYVDRNVTFTANVSHNRGPSLHGIDKYEWDLDGNGTFEEINDSNIITHSYGWIDTNEKKIKVKIRVTCDGGQEALAEIQIILKRPEHKIVCKTLTAVPSGGTVPLGVDFKVTILDTWGFPITNYKWDFDGNSTWDRETQINKTKYTYVDRGGFTVYALGENNQGVPSEACPVDTNISAESWSELQWIEIAP